ncbi:cytochrome c-type biogenesis protein CcmH [Aestuariibius sp. 2305UL40-4]|uniref:cytochrome c-type biogenesis protein n=1 Tax=Aestuariibius violaceus TaxID=3234132 RepID=UPI00345E3642
MRWLAVLLMLWAVPALAVEPGEMLDDPVLEERAREISKGLRCPVCQNESIDESNAELASDLRVLVRERLVAGDSDEEAVNFIVARYGEFVLLRPGVSGTALILWIAGPVMLLLALFVGWRAVRRRAPEDDTLSAEEEARLRELLKE